MDVEQTLALYRKGKVAWNIWAEQALASRAILEANREWEARDDSLIPTLGTNAKTIQWLEDAAANFSNQVFERADFEEFIFPSLVTFDQTEFKGQTVFVGATFHGYAHFLMATFAGTLFFSKAVFKGRAQFTQVVFHKPATFRETSFHGHATFYAIRAENMFELMRAKFDMVPEFTQAHFVAAPRLDNANFCVASPEARAMRRTEHFRSRAPARWRALKLLAIQSHDHEREQQFLAEEIKSQRYFTDWPLPIHLNFFKEDEAWPNVGRYWTGLFYQYFSDFGRSTLRPLFALAALAVLSALFYLDYHWTIRDPSGQHAWARVIGDTASTVPQCIAGNGDPRTAATYLAINNGLLFSGLGGSPKLEQSYLCLYGGSLSEPAIPDLVVYIGLLQTLFSTVLTFLLFLALRNYFRIK